jgi:CDP-diacylglycerol--glycerol-3-phosphate 3-phosphatidyltransferase
VDGEFSWSEIRLRDFLLLPNLITLLRLFLLPLIFYFLLKDTTSDFILALILIGIAYFSDMLDGYFARKLHQESDLGKILDPLVDKLAVGSVALYTVIYKGFPLWALILVLTKDILIVLGGFYLVTKRKTVPQPNKWGKYTVCMWGVVLFLYLIELSFWKELLLWIGVGMILITLFTYLKRFLNIYLIKH